MTDQETIKQFFANDIVRDVVSVMAVEKKAGIPKEALASFLRGQKYRHLTSEQIKKLVPILEEIGFKKSLL